jgi:hypothetical protein
MKRRIMSWMLLLALALGGLSACGEAVETDDDDLNNPGIVQPEGDDGEGGEVEGDD